MNCPREFAPGELIAEEIARGYLKECGPGVKIYSGCRILHGERIRVGKHSQIDEGVWIYGGEEIDIGAHVHLAFGSSITGGGRCYLKDFAGIGAGVRLITGTDLIDGSGFTNPTVPQRYRAVRRGSLEIGAHAVIFTNSIVMPDVVIGEGAVVAAGSLVHHSLKAWTIYAGNPLVQVGVRDKKKVLEMAEELLAAEEKEAPAAKIQVPKS